MNADHPDVPNEEEHYVIEEVQSEEPLDGEVYSVVIETDDDV